MADKLTSFDFSALVAAIRQTHEYMAAQAGRAVNISLTLRNWVNRQFYLTYPEIWQTASAKSQRGLPPDPIWQTLSAKFAEAIPATIRKSLVSEFTAVARPTIRGSVTPELQLPPERLVNSLSFSHFAELIAIDGPLKRTFYEIECIRGNWSVRELKRQIGSLYYERSGLSMDKEKLAELVKAGADQAEPKLAIRDPYIFEFLGLKPKEVMSDSSLEDQLLDKLEDFFLELELPKKEKSSGFWKRRCGR